MTNYEAAVLMTKNTYAHTNSKRINPWLSLAQGIVMQAINDWRALSDDVSVPRANYTELRKFFDSQWCELLLTYSGIHQSRIIATLERDAPEKPFVHKYTPPRKPPCRAVTMVKRDAIRALYDAGKNDREIAEVIGCSSVAISAWRRREGLPSHYNLAHKNGG